MSIYYVDFHFVMLGMLNMFQPQLVWPLGTRLWEHLLLLQSAVEPIARPGELHPRGIEPDTIRMSWGCLNKHQWEKPCRAPQGHVKEPKESIVSHLLWRHHIAGHHVEAGILEFHLANDEVPRHHEPSNAFQLERHKSWVQVEWHGQIYVLPDPWSWMMDTSATYARNSSTKHRTVIPPFDCVGCSKMFQGIPIKYCFMWTHARDSTKFTKSRDARILTWNHEPVQQTKSEVFQSNVVPPELSQLPVPFG